MPKRTDIHTILIIGSGPIVIGQGCEFDYSGVQACRALKEEGYRIVLVNSNPATIMTDPEFADATYIEPITPECIEKILERESKGPQPIDAVLPTLGGQTGLNTAMACFDQGIFTKYGVTMIGANREAIFRGEDRQVFKDLMIQIGLKVPRSGVVHNMDEARKVLHDIGLPLIIRPAFTLGGTGGGIAYNIEEFEATVQRGLDASPVTEVLIEQSVIGWKEFEMEVMRDRNDNVVIICSIENLDPMGVHTGDSITVAPIQTLTDKEYQRMRDASIAVIRAVGVETGGSNIQFAIDPDTGEMVVVEMNPRVSRSSALASKATGYPIAKLAAKLAVGYTLDELPNYITSRKKTSSPSPATSGEISSPSPGTPGEGRGGGSSSNSQWDLYTSACFEPTIDYCVIKIPRWTFEKFPDADETLTTQMKSVGEAMAIGRTFKEALQKGIRSMEVKRFGFGLDKYDKWLNAQHRSTGFQPVPPAQRENPASPEHGLKTHATNLPPTARATDDLNADKTTQGESLDQEWPIPEPKLRRKLAVPSQGRLYYVRYALKMGWTIEQIHELTNIDPWFLGQMQELVEFESNLALVAAEQSPSMDYFALTQQAKQLGYSDVQLAQIFGISPREMRDFRRRIGVQPVYKLVDTCAAEFEAATPYYYSTYETPFTSAGVEPPKTAVRDAINALREAKSMLDRLGPAKADEPPAHEVDDIASQLPTTWVSPSASEDEIRLTTKPKVIIIGGGPNRIGQGIEFDYCCVHAAFAMRELGLESVMINSNPETVSTDYDTSDLLFFEPLTHEDVLNICERLNGGPFRQNTAEYVKNLTDHTIPQEIIDQLDHELYEGGGERAAIVSAIPSKTELILVVLYQNPRRLQTLTFNTKTWRSSSTEADAHQVAKQNITAWQKAIAWFSSPTRNQQPATSNLVRGVIVQFGGQTPLNLAKGLQEAGVPILGTTVESLDAAGDREQFRTLLQQLNLRQPANGIARNLAEARDIARRIGYPVLVRPSFVLGGRAMEIVSDEDQLNYYMTHAVEASTIVDAPILVDKFLDNATEVDVDCLADYTPSPLVGAGSPRPLPSDKSGKSGETPPLQEAGQAIIIGVMEHIEEAGIHSGDSACALPPYSLSKEIVEKLKLQTRALAAALRVNGLMNVQYAIKDNEIYVIEVNPRASRTVPFVSKATGIPWAKIAAKVMAGKTLKELNITEQPDPKHVSVKEVVFPFTKFPGVDIILGPEMRSTGEVMGIDVNFEMAFAKSQIAAGGALPTKGAVFISVRDADKAGIVPVAKMLAGCGFNLLATSGTYDVLAKNDIPASRISKLAEGRPNIKDHIKNGNIQLIINTPTKKGPQTDEGKIRAMAVSNRVPIVTTLTGASAAAKAIAEIQKTPWGVQPLQQYVAAMPKK